ncbi:MAG: glycosyltransferase [Gammaproteobacteria bacterium]|nr:glycosyltransferase [Gammaproteobacteria bacterium]MDH3559778.1 glycosyltransferase [Gammaproteobacteria bacterium]
MSTTTKGLHLVLLSIHGLIRGHELELGRDDDTGGQIRYVVELARTLGERDDVARVDLLTRRVLDSSVSSDYARQHERLTAKVSIVRIECGEDAYIPKEQLWDCLDSFADNALSYIREHRLTPDIIHSHYADAGYVGIRLSSLLGIPLVHTGHSLGRVKRQRLLASGLKRDAIERSYNISRRIEVEEDVLGAAELVITSTHQEIEEQYGLYNYYQPEQMTVIPPGTELDLFFPPDGSEQDSPMRRELARFLSQPDKPVILALSRPDARKNLGTLLEVYGESAALQQAANLVIVAGTRNDIREMGSRQQEVLTDLLLTIDQYDLYGKVAYPKQHQSSDVPDLYRLAAASHGVFINPALTEPFGLTLIEAAASGLPIVATEDGGPRDIIGNCHNGYLVDPLDRSAIEKALLKILSDSKTWQSLADSGLDGVRRHYSWQAHVDQYLDALHALVARAEPPVRPPLAGRPSLYHDRAIFSDLDQNLLTDPKSLASFINVVRENRKCATFGIATGRRLDMALRVMKQYGIPQPDVLITSLGTEIHYAPRLTADYAWVRHIDHLWNLRAVMRVLADLPGIKLQPKTEQSRFKISYYIDPNHAPGLDEINSLLHQHEQTVSVFLSFGQFLDIVPVRASKGFALRWFADQWEIPLEHILVAGGSGADEDMMRGNTMAVVVANRHHEELSALADVEHIYFATQPYAAGILEAIEHYRFFHNCNVPRT